MDRWRSPTPRARPEQRGEDEFGFHGSFHEVRPNEVIIQTFTFEGVPDGVALERAQFEALPNGRTRLTVTSLVGSFEERAAILERNGPRRAGGLREDLEVPEPDGQRNPFRRAARLAADVGSRKTESMSKREVDDYLASLDEPKRSTLESLRKTIREILPEADEGISYGVPAFRLQGKVIAGFAAFKGHLSYLPHSGSVFQELGEDVAKYKTSSGALQFPVDRPLPKALVRKLISVRKRQAFDR